MITKDFSIDRTGLETDLMRTEHRFDGTGIAKENQYRGLTGIPHVIVNGIIVMKDSEPTRRFDAGQPIRFEVQKKGRFEPLTEEGWTKTFYASPIDFGGGVPGSQPNMRGNPLEQFESHEIH